MPIRILLVGAVVFLAAWFTILSPKDPVVPVEPTAPATAPTAPGGAQSKAGSFRDTAKAGAAAAEKDALGAANANIEGETAAPSAAAPSATSSTPPATATRPARPAAEVVPAKAVANLPRDVREGLQDRKVVVLGVLTTETKPWDQMPDDDRAVRNALRDVNRYRGNVVVRQVTIGSLVKYDGMLEALNVTQSPTVVVIDRNRKAVALTGYLDRPSINQAIADARRFSTETLIRDPYLAKLNQVCGHYAMRYDRWSMPTVRGGRNAAIARWLSLARKDRRSMARLAAPAKWRALKAQLLRTQDLAISSARGAVSAGKRGDVAGVIAAITAHAASFKAMDRRLNAVGLTACAHNRTA